MFFLGAYAGFLVYFSTSEYLYLCIIQENVDRTLSRGRKVFCCYFFFFRTKMLSTVLNMDKVPGNKVTAFGGEVSRVFLCSSGWSSNLRSSSLCLLIIGMTAVCYHIWLGPQHGKRMDALLCLVRQETSLMAAIETIPLVFVLLLAS